jgi:hypothetical protein
LVHSLLLLPLLLPLLLLPLLPLLLLVLPLLLLLLLVLLLLLLQGRSPVRRVCRRLVRRDRRHTTLSCSQGSGVCM